MRGPGGADWLFRFYDPRLLPPFLAACSLEERSTWYGDSIEAFMVAWQGCPWHEMPRPEGAVTTARPGRFQIRREHVEAMSASDANGRAASVAMDLRRLGYSTRPDSGGQIVITDARGGVGAVALDESGYPREVVTPTGRRFCLVSDRSGKITALRTPAGEDVRIIHDAAGRATEVHQRGLGDYRIAYTGAGKIAQLRLPDGATYRAHHDDEGRMVESLGLDGAVTRYVHTDGLLTAITDPLGRTTSFHAKDRRLAGVVHPDGLSEAYSYSERAGLATLRRRDGSVVAYDHDAPWRSLTIDWAGEETAAFTTDADGRSLTAENHAGRTLRRYGERGELVFEADAAGESRWSHDPDGRPSTLQYASAGAVDPQEVSYHYDGDGELREIRAWGRTLRIDGYENARTYYLGPWLQETQETFHGGRLARTRLLVRGRTLDDLRFEYDVCERVRSIAEHGLAPEPWILDLTYDAGGRVASEQVQGAGTPRRRYTYDLKGNLVHDGVRATVQGVMDEPQAVGPHRLEYDALGQVTRGVTREQVMDCRFGPDGTLRQVTTAGHVVRFQVDAFGRRVQKDGPAGCWRYLWAGHQLLREEHDNPGGMPLTRRDYLYLPGESSPVAFREDGVVYWMQRDARGAVVCVCSEAGQIVWSGRYDSYGAVEVLAAEVRQPWRLDGQYEDDETGLHYSLCRYYCPTSRSYLSRDPLWFLPGASSYAYCANDPWNRVDPLGGFWHIVAGGVIGGLVGGITAAVRGENIWAGALEGAVIGAAFAVNPILGGVAAFGTNVVRQGVTNGWDKICWSCAALQGLLTGLLGWLGGKALGALGNAIVTRARGLIGVVAAVLPRWAAQPFQIANTSLRGFFVEAFRRGNLPKNFPVIDKWLRGVATSIKSIDPRMVTYQQIPKFRSTLNAYVKKLDLWQGQTQPWGGVAVPPSAVQQKVLEIVVPRGSLTPAHQAVIDDLVRNAQQNGIIVKIFQL